MQLWPVNNILMIFFFEQLIQACDYLFKTEKNFGTIFNNKKVRAIWNIEAVLEISKYQKLSGAISPASKVSERSFSGSGIFFFIPQALCKVSAKSVRCRPQVVDLTRNDPLARELKLELDLVCIVPLLFLIIKSGPWVPLTNEKMNFLNVNFHPFELIC